MSLFFLKIVDDKFGPNVTTLTVGDKSQYFPVQNSNSSWNSSTSAAAAVAVYRGLSSERIAATQDLSSFPAIVTVGV